METLLVSIQSTLQLSEWLWDKGYIYILTSKLSKDPLERHFGILRSFTCDDHPSVVDFLHLHLLQCIYVPTKQALSSGGNCELRVDTPLTSYVNQMRLLARKQEDFNKDVIAYVESSLKQKIII